VINLQSAGERRALFAVLARVITPGGRLIAGELILSGSGPLHNFAKEVSDPIDFRPPKTCPKLHPRQESIGC